MSSSKELFSKPLKRARTMPSFPVSSRSASWNRECAEGSFFAVNSPLPTSSRKSRSFLLQYARRSDPSPRGPYYDTSGYATIGAWQ